MVRKLTLTFTRSGSPAPTASVLGSEDLASVNGGAGQPISSVMKTRHETAKNAIGNIR